MKNITINIPDDYEIKIIKKEEKKEPIIKTYQDLIDNSVKITGYYMSGSEIYDYDIYCACDDNVDVALSKKVAKSMQAMAMISQLMPFYGGEITNEEWKKYKLKFVIERYHNEINLTNCHSTYYFLAFHTKKQRNDFFKYNKQLVKDYLMID